MDAGGGGRFPTPATGSGTEATAPGTEAKTKELETAMKALASERKFKDAQKIKLEIAALRAPSSLNVVPASSAPLESPERESCADSAKCIENAQLILCLTRAWFLNAYMTIDRLIEILRD